MSKKRANPYKKVLRGINDDFKALMAKQSQEIQALKLQQLKEVSVDWPANDMPVGYTSKTSVNHEAILASLSVRHAEEFSKFNEAAQRKINKRHAAIKKTGPAPTIQITPTEQPKESAA